MKDNLKINNSDSNSQEHLNVKRIFLAQYTFEDKDTLGIYQNEDKLEFIFNQNPKLVKTLSKYEIRKIAHFILGYSLF